MLNNKYSYSPNQFYIHLDSYYSIIINKQDFPNIYTSFDSLYKWQPRNSNTYYCRGQLTTGKKVYLHRWLLKATTLEVVDHINHNGLDNRRENLRLCSIAQNVFNRKGAQDNNKSTGKRGICHTIQRKIVNGKNYEYEVWQAYFTINGKRKIKNFKSLMEAANFLENERPNLV